MAEAVDITEEEKREEDKRVVGELLKADGELQDLFDLMFGIEDQGEDSSFGITLSMPNGVLGGMAIPRKTWSKRVNESLRSGMGNGGGQVAEVREQLAELFESRQKEARAERRQEGRPLPPRGFIHLKDAELRSGGQSFSLGNVRVDLSHVSAWTLGTLGQ